MGPLLRTRLVWHITIVTWEVEVFLNRLGLIVKQLKVSRFSHCQSFLLTIIHNLVRTRTCMTIINPVSRGLMDHLTSNA